MYETGFKPEMKQEEGMGMLDVRKILEQVDHYFEEKKGQEAEKLLRESAAQAIQEQDDGSLLQLLNELLGYYRETGQEDNALQMAAQSIAQARRMGLEGTLPYATTLLNVASAYRVFGKLEESMEYYRQVQELYDVLLEPDSMFRAGLKNNIALLYQEMGDFKKAKENLLEALKIVENKDAPYEQGVSLANLASTCIQLGELEGAYDYGIKSMKIFRGAGIMDNHYGGALAALGTYYFRKGDYERAGEYFGQAADIVEKCVGRNGFYYRLQENLAACEKARNADSGSSKEQKSSREQALDGAGAVGRKLAREYYETFGKAMIEEKFPSYADRIAVGLAGGGSDCFGYDDEASRDHDWGPDFCMWVTDETYEEIGEALEQAYEALPEEFGGYRRAPRVNGQGRRGVIKISDFYRHLTGASSYEQIDWRQVKDASLAAAVNGEVFRDQEGIFTAFREKLKGGYPEEILYLKVAETAAGFSQTAQYNYFRMLGRGEELTASMMVWEGIREAMKLQHYIEGKYPPHDKWLYRSLQESEEGREVAALLNEIAEGLKEGGRQEQESRIERLGAYFAMELYAKGYISDTESYLDAHSQELVYKASLGARDRESLAEEIARLEFEAFDKVKNEGGRASCQNDWGTFSIMRKSQYLTWNRQMLKQYLYDFYREYHRGHNLIEEKYGRMMESTAPEKYEEIKDHFPELSPEKKNIIEQIVGMQVSWMEEFAEKYPALAGNARTIHTSEDTAEDTSYETYLRGELGTYSDKMLELYGRYVVEYARSGKNPARDIMENSVKMYGYADIEEAEREVGKQL